MSRKPARIWIDLDNSPHVPFFVPIIQELAKRGHSTFLTARDCFQVCDLADLYHLSYKRVGRHHGKHKLLKVGGLCYRATQLLPVAWREGPDLALSHGSRSQLICSAMMGVPCISIFDYEFARSLQFLHPKSWTMAPEVISAENTSIQRERFLTYPGIKEDVYVAGLKPDPGIRTALGLHPEDLVVTLRPPAEEAHYHSPQSDELFRAAVEFLASHSGVRMVLLPRNHKQGVALEHRWPRLFAEGKIRIPDHAVDGLNLIWNSDLVISGGGTMNREAAALRVPVYSVFRGKIGAVDHYLAKNGRLVLLETADDVHTKIVLAHREPSDTPAAGESRSLQAIVDHVERILEITGRVGSRGATATRPPLPTRAGLDEMKNEVPELVRFAVRGLPQMFDSATGLFCQAFRNSSQGFARAGQSRRYTLITLLGLHEYQAAGGEKAFDLEGILSPLRSDLGWIDNLGDLGLLLWVCSMLKPATVEELCRRPQVKLALSQYLEAARGSTMELSWFLSGVSHAALAGAADSQLLSSLAFETHRLVAQNQGEHGFFGHHTKGANLAERMRARIGAFADQVYPIYAFSRFAQAFSVEEAAKDALRCARAICHQQGPLGQWWWHYDAVTGKVMSKYPVFSVHQAGMAPMALIAVGQASGVDFSPNIYHGLKWIYGSNELNCDFRETDGNLIWRSIYARRYRRYWRPLAARVGVPEKPLRPSSLEVLREAWPYEVGWLLYAFASQSAPTIPEGARDLSCARA